MKAYVRVDEKKKTGAQKDQRARTYEAARLLRSEGFPCDVREWFTGSDKDADAASIVLHQREERDR